MALELGIDTPGGTDEKVKITANDTTASYLATKLVPGSDKITLTEINDGSNETLEIDVNESALSLNAKDIFFTNIDRDSPNLGDYNSQIAGSPATFAYCNIFAPNDYNALTSLELIIIPTVTNATHSITVDSDYATSGEAYNNHSGSSTANYNVTANQLFSVDISSIFGSLTANDYCGVKITNNELDDMVVLGIRLKYTI